MEKNVKVELRTIIDDNGQMEYNTLREPGKFYQKGQVDVITFEEKTEEGTQAVTKNLITIQPGKVSIKRSGVVAMTQQFRAGQATENVYHHPHGTIHMETRTEDMSYQPLSEAASGHLKLTYAVKLNGEEARNHQLDLFVEEETE
ncbi:DUF1934 domain-containing protein [Lentibacillus sediminis]|uniref:DUF1934 domain-containing protein n=1 Tax=Lentibacillus sediminis TaxID=1940529 RepID=UPI000C1C54DF|nr:DUF1934 domain-containing protein [Lentibacillus sediminis]